MQELALTINTERLLLRPWRREDLDAMAAWPPFVDPLDRVWNWPRRFQQEGTLDLFFLSQSADPSRRAWTILRDEVVIGLLQLKQIRPVERDACLGIALGCHWIGQGYGCEGLSAFLESYYERIRFACLRLEVGLANERARRLYDALGFRETRRLWRDAGLREDYRFLDAPQFAALRPYFRWTGDGVYQLCAEMEMDSENYRRSVL